MRPSLRQSLYRVVYGANLVAFGVRAFTRSHCARQRLDPAESVGQQSLVSERLNQQRKRG
jgi:hypothetical protein